LYVRSSLPHPLNLEPIAEAFNPAIDRQVLFFHPKAMAALGIKMQFRRLSGFPPGRI
jgi:hypothetical protein